MAVVEADGVVIDGEVAADTSANPTPTPTLTLPLPLLYLYSLLWP